MPHTRRTFPVAVLAVAALAWSAPADEVTDKQKKVALENLEKAEVKKAAVAETEAFIVCGPLPADRLKTLGTNLQKTYKMARKGLQYDPKEEPWKGKLTVFVLPAKDQFGSFMRLVAGVQAAGNWHVATRSDEPYIVATPESGEKATNTELASELSPAVAGALLAAKAGSGAAIPAWVRSGFGRAAALRAGGTSGERFTTYKSQVRKALLGGGGQPPATLVAVWDGERQDAPVLAAGLMDYMAFGPGAANFPKFLAALRPDDNGNDTAINAAIESAGWKAPELEAAWRKWVLGGMVVK